jgi:hypothetical protein
MCVDYLKVNKSVFCIDNVIYIVLKVLLKPMSFINVAINVVNEYCIGYNLYKLWFFYLELIK